MLSLDDSAENILQPKPGLSTTITCHKTAITVPLVGGICQENITEPRGVPHQHQEKTFNEQTFTNDFAMFTVIQKTHSLIQIIDC